MNITLFTPKTTKHIFEQILRDLNVSNRFILRTYQDLGDIKTLYAEIDDQTSGILLTGNIPYNYLKLAAPHNTLPVRYVETTTLVPACLRLIRHQITSPEIPLHQVFCDFLGDLNNYTLFSEVLTPEQMPHTFTTSALCDDFFQKASDHILHLYESGTIKKAYLTLTNLYECLLEKQVPCELVPIPHSSIQAAVQDMLLLIDGNPNQPRQAVLLLDFTAHASDPVELEYKEATLMKTLVDYKRQLSTDRKPLITKGPGNLEVALLQSSDSASPESQIQPLLEYIRRNCPFPLDIGAGIDIDPHTCRKHALQALQYAQDFGIGYTFCLSPDKLSGPENEPECMSLPSSLLSMTRQSAKHLGISNINYVRLLMLLHKGEITSDAVSENLHITIRSANRLLANLLENNIVELVTPSVMELRKKGRPGKIYKLKNNLNVI